MAFRRAILPVVLSLTDKPVMTGILGNTNLIACHSYIYYIAWTGAQFLITLLTVEEVCTISLAVFTMLATICAGSIVINCALTCPAKHTSATQIIIHVFFIFLSFIKLFIVHCFVFCQLFNSQLNIAAQLFGQAH